MPTEGERHTHESYAQIRFSRVSGRANFYGSELEQDHFITLEIDRSEIDRSLTQDYHFSRENLIKLRLTASQFSELITSMNMGSGIPCTLERVGGKRVSPLPDIENRKEFVHRKFEDRMKEFGKGIKERQEKALKLIAKKTLSKKDQEDLNFHIQLLTQEIERNIPYFGKCFQENVDEVVQEAKLEIENAIQHKVTTLGMEALHEKNQLLSDGGGEKGAE